MKQVTDLTKDARVYVVIGEVGSGKTSLIKNHPGKNKVLVSFDSSYSTVADVPNLRVFEPEKSDLKNINVFTTELTKEVKGADLIVFDNISALQNTIVYEPKTMTGNADGRAAYGYVQKFLYLLADWSIGFDGDVLFTAWSKNNEITQEVTGYNGKKEQKVVGFSIEADMNMNAFNRIAGFATTVSRTVADSNGYFVIMSPDGRGIIKNRVNKIKVVPNDKYWDCVKYVEPKAKPAPKNPKAPVVQSEQPNDEFVEELVPVPEAGR